MARSLRRDPERHVFHFVGALLSLSPCGGGLRCAPRFRHPGLAKREPGSFQTQVSVFYDPLSAAHRSAARAAHRMALRRCVRRKARSGPTTKCLLRRRTESLCRGRQSGLGARFTPLRSDFGPFSPVSLTRCMQKARSLCGRGAIQSDCGKQPLAAPGSVNRGMVNCIYFRSDFAPERAFFGLQVRKSAAG